MFISICYMFRATMCSPSGESVVSIRHLAYVTVCGLLSGMQVWMELSSIHTCIPDGHFHRVTRQMSYWYSWFSWWWAHGCSKHVKYRNVHIRKRTVHQVGYLQGLYWVAQSTKHKMFVGNLDNTEFLLPACNNPITKISKMVRDH